MKTLLQKPVLVSMCLLAVLLFLFGCKEDSASKKMIAPTEDSIDLSNHPVSAQIGLLQMATFKDSILVDSTVILPICADSIQKNAFKLLKDSALKLRNDTNGIYIPALRIYYGLNDLKTKVRLFYQPVCLKRKTGNGPGSNVEYVPLNSPYYYEYNGNAFAAITNMTVLTTAKNLYMNHITFRMPNGHFRLFKNVADSTGDIKGCLFSFQEITSVIKHNNSKYLYILNSGESMNLNNKRYLKHVILLGPDSLEHHVKDIFYRKYGNLSHLCPPSCNVNVFYNIK